MTPEKREAEVAETPNLIAASPAQLYGYARKAVAGVINQWFGSIDYLREDLVQEVVLSVYAHPQYGHSKRLLRLYALRSILKWFKTANRVVRQPDLDLSGSYLAEATGADPELKAIALWRLQRIYPKLTEVQKTALLDYFLCDDTYDDRHLRCITEESKRVSRQRCGARKRAMVKFQVPQNVPGAERGSTRPEVVRCGCGKILSVGTRGKLPKYCADCKRTRHSRLATERNRRRRKEKLNGVHN